MRKRLNGKNILLGVTGSIAAYKACEVLRALQCEGAEIKVVMTEAAAKFVCPLTFETLSTHKVVTTLFPERRHLKTEHVHLAEWADVVLICPATANMIGKVASGIADDFLSTTVMASRSPILFVPAMDRQMVRNPIYLSNVTKLKKIGHCFLEPESGHLASGLQGPGRLVAVQRIVESVMLSLLSNDRLKGKRILITAGPTQEPIDPVRYITNPSTGTMGYALAEAALFRGADVTLISGPTKLNVHAGVKLISVQRTAEMAEAVFREWPQHQVLVMSAAVSDFKPVTFSKKKIKKQVHRWQLDLEETEDILATLGSKEKHGLLVGFALETENGVANAIRKLKEKQLDLICLNMLESGAGFGDTTNQVTLIDRGEKIEKLPFLSKWEVSEKILDKIETLLEE